jgi:multidrug resistance efflux pump
LVVLGASWDIQNTAFNEETDDAQIEKYESIIPRVSGYVR